MPNPSTFKGCSNSNCTSATNSQQQRRLHRCLAILGGMGSRSDGRRPGSQRNSAVWLEPGRGERPKFSVTGAQYAANTHLIRGTSRGCDRRLTAHPSHVSTSIFLSCERILTPRPKWNLAPGFLLPWGPAATLSRARGRRRVSTPKSWCLHLSNRACHPDPSAE